MAYSNGYDVTAVTNALQDRIGFRQPLGSGVPTLTSAVTTTNSGRYFQDFHALVTVANIKATMEQVSASDADLITHLTNIRKAGIMRSLNGVFNEPQVIDQPHSLFTRLGQSDVLETNAGKFIGFRIVVAENADAALQLDALQLYFNESKTFNVYLFKDGKASAVFTQSVTTVADTVTEVVLSEKILTKGIYYLGYFQDDLGTAKAYRQQVKQWSKSLAYEAEPMKADAIGSAITDRDEISYPADPTGLNVEVSSFRDHTAQIKRKAPMFDELIGLTVAYQVIEQVIYAVRSNANERILKEQLDKVGIQLDLNGAAPISDGPKVTGLKQRIERELERVKKSFYPVAKAVTVNLAEC